MLTLRDPTPDDVPEILSLIRELATYERDPDAVATTEADLLRDGFGGDPRFHVVIAEWNGAVAGMAFWFLNYSTWRGKPGIYLEDIFVRQAFRRRGIGRALILRLGAIARERSYDRLVLQVLDWNQPAIEFYRSLGAKTMGEWITMRFDEGGIAGLVP
jgi:GNAT superfamily N-acetyltransferase